MKKKKINKRYVKKRNYKEIEITGSLLLVICFILLMITSFKQPVYYDLKDIKEDGSIETIDTFTSFTSGKDAYLETLNSEQYTNPVLLHDHKIYLIKYGLVNFKMKECTVNTLYKLENGEQGYINGCYGTNALFIDGDEETIKFKMSGVTGNVNREDVEIINYKDSKSIDYYEIKNNEMFHKLSDSILNDVYTNSIYVGKVLPEMKQNYYYSYDGHYFYDNFYTMADNERNGITEGSVNSKPYYNYYQFVSHKKLSNYTSYELNTYINKVCDSSSKLYSTGDYFKKYENLYHVNSAMMLSLAMNESNYGKSKIAYEKNNLFGHKVYDSNASAGNAYKSIESCIESHARDFLNNDYLNPESVHFKGEYFGDKAGGLNVMYASDPYWGEKSANFYARLDEYLGFKDK